MEKLIKEAFYRNLEAETRRNFLKKGFFSLGGIALGSLLGCERPSKVNFETQKLISQNIPNFAPKAKSVIYLHMAGAPSQLELFEYKPELDKLDGQDCPKSFLEGKKFAFIRGVPKMLASQAKFKQFGESGHYVSNYLPHLTNVVDELSFIRAVNTDQFNHAPAQLLFQTGTPRLGRPSIGSWVTYGLGSENNNLPSFVVLTSGGNNPDAGKSAWGSGFLPSVYQGVQCRSEGDPVLFLNDPKGISRETRKESIKAINDINLEEYKTYKDPEILSRISQYELAYRMQISVPEVMNINNEPAYIHELYGTEPGKTALSNNLLLARKLVESGVRFVQIYDWGWDSHGTNAQAAVDIGLKEKCKKMDRPVSALILDLKQRGLLDETLVVWGGEFGRTPMAENREGKQMAFKGRDHHGEAFTMWMCGGGIKKGASYGETDEIGYSPVKGKVNAHDIQATILNQLGINHEQLTYEFQGRQFRLTDTEGKVISQIIS